MNTIFYKVRKGFIFVFLLSILVGCSSTAEEMKVEELEYNQDLLAQLVFDKTVYSIEGNKTPAEKIKKEIGEIEKEVEELKENGEYQLFNSGIEGLDGAKIFSIKEVDKDTVVAVKVQDVYYTAIVTRSLE